MLDVPLSAIVSVVGRVLDIFRQKVHVYVEVSFGAPRPFALTVVNRSNFTVAIEELSVEPDGFPTDGNGWHLSGARLFKGQRLIPGQRIRFYFATPDFGRNSLRRFAVRYCSVILGKRIPRSSQHTEYDFNASSNTIAVVASLPISYKVEAACSSHRHEQDVAPNPTIERTGSLHRFR